MSHQRSTASVRSGGPRLAALAVGALAFGVASVASAQSAPSGTQAMPQQQQQPVQQQPMQTQQPPTAIESQSTATMPVDQPTTTSTQTTSTSTTKTTGAEYNENIGAEKTTTRTPPNPALLGTGAILLGGPYIAGAIVAATNSHSYDDKLYIPVAGPWIDLGERPCTFASRCTNADHWNAALLIGSGIAQGAGLAMMIASIFVPARTETTTVSNAKAKPQKPEKPHVAVTPVSLHGGAGVGAVGTF
jgi:hypothetical protein